MNFFGTEIGNYFLTMLLKCHLPSPHVSHVSGRFFSRLVRLFFIDSQMISEVIVLVSVLPHLKNFQENPEYNSLRGKGNKKFQEMNLTKLIVPHTFTSCEVELVHVYCFRFLVNPQLRTKSWLNYRAGSQQKFNRLTSS